MAKQKFYETADFKKIQKEWVKKLKDSGFEDSEYFEDYNDELLIKPKVIGAALNSRVLTGDEAVYIKYSITIRKMVNGKLTLHEVKLKESDYYQFCHRLLRDLNFKKEFDTKAQSLSTTKKGLTKGEKYQAVFELHAEGYTQAEIADSINTKFQIAITRQAVSLIIDTVKARFIEIERG